MNIEYCLLCKLEFVPRYLIRGTWCRCPRCGLISVIRNKIRLGDYENDYYFYDENLDKVNIARSRQFIEFVKKMTASVGVMLDIGCGKGFFVKTAVEKGWYAYGIDISHKGTYYASSRLALKNIKCGKLEEAMYQHKFFDVITIWETIEHLEKPWSMLKVAFDLLKPGGKLFISTPNAGSLYVTILGDKWHGFSDLHFQNHLVYYNPKTLQIACRRIGFTDIRLMTAPPHSCLICFHTI